MEIRARDPPEGKAACGFGSHTNAIHCAYMYFQHRNQDYKEMGAGLLAVAFALLHLARTFMGLWQLHVFKQWAIFIDQIDGVSRLRDTVAGK